MDDWQKEVDFWYGRVNAAHYRVEDAIKRGANDDFEIAFAQVELCNKRCQAAVPEEVRKIWDERKEAEREAALSE